MTCCEVPRNPSKHLLLQAGLAGMLGMAGSANVQGEDQKKLDILANDVFISMLTVSISAMLIASCGRHTSTQGCMHRDRPSSNLSLGHRHWPYAAANVSAYWDPLRSQRSKQCAVLVSEENDDPIIIDEEHRGVCNFRSRTSVNVGFRKD